MPNLASEMKRLRRSNLDKVKRTEHLFLPDDGLHVVIDPQNWWRKPFRLSQPLEYSNRLLANIIIPAGFECDAASIPSWLRWLPGMSRIAKHARAAVVHDWLYARPNGYDRRIVDAIFLSIMKHDGVNVIVRTAMYVAVRLCGGKHWR